MMTERIARARAACRYSALGVALALSPAVTQAQATGTWTSNAGLLSATCQVTPPQPVRLPTISTLALATPDVPTTLVPVTISLFGCDTAIARAQVAFVANPDGFKPQYFKTDGGSGQATGVAIYLGTADGQRMDANGSNNVSPPVAISNSGTASLAFKVGYVGNGQAVSPGGVNARITFNVQYP